MNQTISLIGAFIALAGAIGGIVTIKKMGIFPKEPKSPPTKIKAVGRDMH